MALTHGEILTYHVVPRFDIAAKGGPLSHGIIVDDLKYLMPLNRSPFHVEVPDELKYTPVTQSDFKDTLAKARSANFKAWVAALGLPVGASADLGGSKDIEKSVSCESIVTTYFDPDPAGEYVRRCLAVKPIQDWLEGSKGHAADLYLITGLKVAKQLKFNKSSSIKYHGGAEGEAYEPHTNAVEAGIAVDVAEEKQQELEFSVDDIVIAYRVNKYRCVRRLFRKDRKIKDKGILDGSMMDGQKSESQQWEMDFELLPIPEEIAAQEQAAADGANECWVDPSV